MARNNQTHTSTNAASYNLYHQCTTTLYSLNSYTSSLLLAGDFLVTGSSNKHIQLRKRSMLTSGSPHNDSIGVVAAGNGAVKALLVSNDKLISAHQDHKIRVWKINVIDENVATITHLSTLPTLGDRTVNMLVPKNRNIQVRRHKQQTWVHHVDAVSALALPGNGSLLYSVSWDRALKIWAMSDFKCLESIPNAHDDAINAIAAATASSHYNIRVYTGSSDNKIKVWESRENRHLLVDTLEKHSSGVNALALTEDGTVLYSGSSDKSIIVWKSTNDGTCRMEAMATLRGHTKPVLCLTLLLEPYMVCSGSADCTVRVWRGVQGSCSYSCLAVVEGHKGPVKCISGAYDSHQSNGMLEAYELYSSSLDCDIKVWKIFVHLTT